MRSFRGFLPAIAGLAILLTLPGCGDDDSPTEPGNHPPVISSVVAEPDTFSRGGLCFITATASDPDGDVLNYAWDFHNGSSLLEWITASGNSAVLTTCGCTIVDPVNAWVLATVSDGKGGQAIDSAAVVVLPGED